MSSILFIGNIQDQVNGGHIQVTLEEYQGTKEMEFHCRVHGTLIPADHPFALRTIAMYLEYQDHWAGSTDLDSMLFQLVYPNG